MIFSNTELSTIFNKEINKDIDNISVDSRDIKNGDLFVALKGDQTDGHLYVKAALQKGASLALVEHEVADCENLIQVPSCYQALLDLAHYNIDHTEAKYVGVTGSIGKTTTKNLIYHLLSQFMPNETYVSKKNFNSQIGLPICASCMPRTTKFGVFEMGMSQSEDITKLIQIVPPTISVITHICETHLEFFNCIWDIAKAKSEIMETQNTQQATIIPADSAYTDFLTDKAKSLGIPNIISFGFSKSSAQIISCKHYTNKTEITADILGHKISYNILCHNNSVIPNSLASIAAAHMISNIDIQDLAYHVETFANGTHRGEIICKNNITVIDDSYNACYSSVRSAIQSLSKYSGRKILVIGDMKELGLNSKYFHENLSPTIDKYGIDLVFACGELTKYLFDNLNTNKKGLWCETSQQLSEVVTKQIQSGDNVLIKGSNSMHMHKIVEAIIHDL